MIHLHDIRYVRIGTPNLDAAQDYATKILGLQLVWAVPLFLGDLLHVGLQGRC
jgi:catechol 2,3-dioxygenase-like lactoylglutathione lyase family enzyme